MTISAQTVLGPFRFIDRGNAQAITAGLMLGGGPGAASVELAAPKALKFLDFIPGLAVKATATFADGYVLEGAVLSRARYMPDRKIIGWLGLGVSVGITKGQPFLVLPVLGMDFLYSEKVMLTVGAAGRGLMLGVGLHRDFGR